MYSTLEDSSKALPLWLATIPKRRIHKMSHPQLVPMQDNLAPISPTNTKFGDFFLPYDARAYQRTNPRYLPTISPSEWLSLKGFN